MAEVALLDSINPSAHEAFGQAGLEVVTFQKSVTPEELAAITEDVRVLGVRSGPAVPGEAMSDSLEVIDVFGVGTNHVDRNTNRQGADDRGIAIFNSAHENTRSVAELVIGGTFSMMRDIAGHNRAMHDGQWTKGDGKEVRGKTMGIIGYGAIGAQVSVLAEAVGMDVVYFDPAPKQPPQGRAARLPDVDAVLATADVVTLHVPGGSEKHMINAETIKRMKRGSYLINAARGDLVDYEAVAAALDSGQLDGVVADVYTDASIDVKEPAKKGDSFDHVLKGHDKATLLPHIGGSTSEAQQSIGRTVASKSIRYLETGNSEGSVNIPNLGLEPVTPGASRLLNIHDNQPGVMAELSDLMAEGSYNVVNTAQRAQGEIGYAAFDVEGKISEELVAAAGALDVTRRVRTIS